MLFPTKRHTQHGKLSGEPNAETPYVDNQVRSAVAEKFLRMDQQHARIREAALAVPGSESNQTELLSDRELS